MRRFNEPFNEHRVFIREFSKGLISFVKQWVSDGGSESFVLLLLVPMPVLLDVKVLREMLHQLFSKVEEPIGSGVEVGPVVVGVAPDVGSLVVPDEFLEVVDLVLVVLLEGGHEVHGFGVLVVVVVLLKRSVDLLLGEVQFLKLEVSVRAFIHHSLTDILHNSDSSIHDGLSNPE